MQVTYPRTANNEKEMSVVRGEFLEVLDDTRYSILIPPQKEKQSKDRKEKNTFPKFALAMVPYLWRGG